MSVTARRALRVLSTANDGTSLGHVTRAIAIARALRRRASERDLEVELLLVTTSSASLPSDAELAVVRLPHPLAARRAGLSDASRRRVTRAAVDAVADAFAPDLVVVDTFPSGPHAELTGLLEGSAAKRVLVRRHVREDRAADEVLTAGLDRFDLVVLADDPVRHDADDARAHGAIARVPPIVLDEGAALPRRDARAALGLPPDARAVLVTCGGGGDVDALANARRVAELAASLEPESVVVLAPGPLADASLVDGLESARVRVLRTASLAPRLRAFDAAFSPAGYNTAHELASARVPFALHAEPRPFDDQAARRDRFAALGLAFALERVDEASISAALAWMRRAPAAAPIASDGADRAADAMLDLFGVRRRPPTEASA